MKIALTFFHSLLIFTSVAQNLQTQKKSDSLLSITYTSFGMSGNFTLKLDSKNIFYTETSRINGNGEVIKKFNGNMSPNNWKELIYYVSLIHLDSLNKLVSPTFSRASDGALYASLIIAFSNKNYQTKDFDEGRPMKELWLLLLQIDQMINKHLIDFKYSDPN